MVKNSSWPVTDLGNKGPLKVLNGAKLTLADHGNNLDSCRISLESFRSFRGPLLLKPLTGQELFFAISYSKSALTPDLRDRQCYECKWEKINQPIFKNSTSNCLWNLDNQLTPHLIRFGFNKFSRTQKLVFSEIFCIIYKTKVIKYCTIRKP